MKKKMGGDACRAVHMGGSTLEVSPDARAWIGVGPVFKVSRLRIPSASLSTTGPANELFSVRHAIAYVLQEHAREEKESEKRGGGVCVYYCRTYYKAVCGGGGGQ